MWQGERERERVSQIFILLHKPYFVKLSTKGKGIRNVQKIVHVVYECPQSYNNVRLCLHNYVGKLVVIKCSNMCNVQNEKKLAFTITKNYGAGKNHANFVTEGIFYVIFSLFILYTMQICSRSYCLHIYNKLGHGSSWKKF